MGDYYSPYQHILNRPLEARVEPLNAPVEVKGAPKLGSDEDDLALYHVDRFENLIEHLAGLTLIVVYVGIVNVKARAAT